MAVTCGASDWLRHLRPWRLNDHEAGRRTSAAAPGLVEPAEQVREEHLEQVPRLFPVLQLSGAEAEYLITSELQVSVAAHAVRVPGGSGRLPSGLA